MQKVVKRMNYSLLWFALCSENFEFLDNMLFQIFELIFDVIYVLISAYSNLEIIRVLYNKTEECKNVVKKSTNLIEAIQWGSEY